MLDKDDIQVLLGLVRYGRGVVFDGLPTATQGQRLDAAEALIRLSRVEAKLLDLESRAW